MVLQQWSLDAERYALWYVAHDAFGRYQWCFNVEFYAISYGAHDAFERNIGAWMRNVMLFLVWCL